MDYPVIDKIRKDSSGDISYYLDQRKTLEESQLLFLDGVRIFDRLYMELHTGNVDETSEAHIIETINYGYPVFLKEAYCDFASLSNARIHPLANEGIDIVRNIIYSCGLLGKSLDLYDLISRGVMYAKKNNKKLLHLAHKEQYAYVDAIEQHFITRYAEMIHKSQNSAFDKLASKQKEILEKMKSLVYIWKDHYIGYNSFEEIEDFFFENAILDTREGIEWRAFPPDCMFGGIKYEVYVNTIVYFISSAIKHMQFCSILQDKHPDLLFENILTSCYTNGEIIGLIADMNNVSREDACKILDAITLNINNLSEHTHFRSASPPFINISSHQYLCSVCGSLDRPFEFLLDNLKFMYPKEWDANAYLREEEFREELYAFFDPEQHIAIHRNIEIKRDGKSITDIDACIIDKKTGTIGFFQLKWQDLVYAKNSYTLSKGRNFREKTSQWISKVREWIESTSEKQIADHLGIASTLVDKQKIKLFVLGRHNCNFASSEIPNPLVAWGQWYQVVFLLAQLAGSNPSIDGLFYLLQMENPFRKNVIHTKNEYKVGDLTLITEGIKMSYAIFTRK